MKKLAMLLIVVLSSCTYDDIPKTTCDVKNPATDLPWLKDKIAELEKSSLHQYFRIEQLEYNGDIFFFVNDCCPNCDTIRAIYNCAGDLRMDVDLSKTTARGIVWQPLDYICI